MNEQNSLPIQLKKLTMQAMLTFAALNVKKMASWTWQGLRIA
ncbi:hypothetical protein [Peribacillus simplex]